MKIKICFSALLFFAMPAAYAGHELDSIIHLIGMSKSDTQKVNLMNDISFHHYGLSFDEQQKWAEQAIELAEKSNYTAGKGRALQNLGDIFRDRSENDNALENYLLALKTLEQAETEGNERMKIDIARVHSQLGWQFANFNADYKKSLQHYLLSFKLFEKYGNKKQISTAYGGLGNIYRLLGENEKAIENGKKSLEIWREYERENNLPPNKNKLGGLYTNIGNIYLNMGKYDEGLVCFDSALTLWSALPDGKNGVGMCYHNMGIAYRGKKEYDKAIICHEACMKLEKELGQEQGTGMSLMGLGGVYYDKREYKKAIDNLEKAIAIINKTGPKDWLTLMYLNIADAYAQSGNYTMAFERHQRYSAIKDTLLNEENTKQINEMSAKYETEKKDKELLKKDAEITKQNAESRQRATERNAFIAGFVLMLSLAFFIFRSYKQKQKANVEILKQKSIIEEKQKEILDSIHYAKRIQQSLLPTEKYIGRNLDRLKKE